MGEHPMHCGEESNDAQDLRRSLDQLHLLQVLTSAV
jgi:hypothetical protein